MTKGFGAAYREHCYDKEESVPQRVHPVRFKRSGKIGRYCQHQKKMDAGAVFEILKCKSYPLFGCSVQVTDEGNRL